MRLVAAWALALAVLLTPSRPRAQAPPEWQRVHTFEDSFIDMSTVRVFNDGDGIFRVTFRWSFDEPQTVGGVEHKSRLEIYQFDCAGGRYRLREVMPLDARGGVITLGLKNADGRFRPASAWSVTGRLLGEACRLVARKVGRESDGAPAARPDSPEAERVLNFARAFAGRLERTRDFAPLVREFFAPDYLGGYLRERDANWLAPLDRETAAKATRAELQRFHTALLNAAYLGGSHIVSKYSRASGEPLPEEELIPPDLLRLVASHPSAAYQGAAGGYDYLAENIDSVERLRSYTDLLERVGGLLRRHAREAERPEGRRVGFRETFEVGVSGARVCAAQCLGLPAGTKLFQVKVPVFRLQVAEVDGELKIVSIGPYSP